MIFVGNVASYPGCCRRHTVVRTQPRKEAFQGFEDIAEWFETLARAERSHAGRFQRALETLDF